MGQIWSSNDITKKCRNDHNKTITLFPSAHGSDNLLYHLDQNNTLLLSFCGEAGCSGEMAESAVFGDPLYPRTMDEEALYRIHLYYKMHCEKPILTIFEMVAAELPLIYDKAGIKFGKRQFQLTKPIHDRTFYFEPNPEEPAEFRPHYGLHIIHAQNVDELELDIKDIKTGKNYDYDQRNVSLDKNIREGIRNAVRKNNPSQLKTCYALLNKLKIDKELKLSEIIYLFTIAGFEEIYILDPTCRSLDSECIIHAALNKEGLTEERPRRGVKHTIYRRERDGYIEMQRSRKRNDASQQSMTKKRRISPIFTKKTIENMVELEKPRRSNNNAIN